MPWEVVHAIEESPFTCICRGGVAPFVKTDIAWPGGGHYHLCFGRCGRQFAQALDMCLSQDLVALREQLADAHEKVTVLDATNARLLELEAEVANRDASLALVTSEKDSALAHAAQVERDLEDERNGQFLRSKVPAAVGELREELAAGTAEKAKPKPRAKVTVAT